MVEVLVLGEGTYIKIQLSVKYSELNGFRMWLFILYLLK